MNFEEYLGEAAHFLKKTTLAQINKALKAAHINAEIVKGKGYWYFTGPDADSMEEQGIYAWDITTASPEELVAEARRRIKD